MKIALNKAKGSFGLGLVLLLSSCSSRFEDPIATDAGLVSGLPSPESPVRAYKGIPFAAPPVGDLRWRAPQPVEPWEGVREAVAFSDACTQRVLGVRLPWTEEFMHQGEASEDCLYLNVWTAVKTKHERRPVMVYFYGGGFNEGSTAVAVYDGEELAKKGVVLVSANYRVGPLGFLAHPELTAESEHGASGNQGMLDMVAALDWVNENIAAFGGDPARVTIFGQSAGAMGVNLLLRSPLAHGLFSGAILQSGPGLIPSNFLAGPTLAEAEEAGLAFAESKGAASLAELRALPADGLYPEGPVRFGPITDGWFLPADASPAPNRPIMNGLTADETLMFAGFGPPPEATVAAYEAEARQRYGDEADTFLALYPAAADSEVTALRKFASQDRARVALSLWASEMAQYGGPVFTYYFSRATPWPEHPEFGAHHTGEVPYVFNNLKALNRPWESADETVADQMSSFWVNFAGSGDPNGPGLPEWPVHRADDAVTMEIGTTTAAIPLADPEKVAFWRSVLMP